VLSANGIKVVTMHGSMSQKKRVDLLNEFRLCNRDGARVLLISNVGSVGLNIACAHILVIVVRTRNCAEGDPRRLTTGATCIRALGRALVCAERAAADWPRLEISAAQTSSRLSPDRGEISGHLLKQHLVWQGVHTRHVLQHGQQAQ
jgi:hypothetical protein